MSNLSPSTLALLRAAKNDAPSKESRAAIWGGVTSGLVTHTPLHITPQGQGAGATGSAAPPPVTTVGAPIGASAAPAAVATKGVLASAAGMTGMKGAFIGALFGSAISIGVATFMLRTKPAPTPQNEIPRAPVAVQITQSGTGTNTQSSSGATAPATANQNAAAANDLSASANSTEIDTLPATVSNAGSTLNSAGSKTSARAATHTATNIAADETLDDTATRRDAAKKKTIAFESPDDMLSRESDLVADARRDLLAGDAAAALKTVRTARALESRQLEPQEMSLEARALHALGRDTEAEKIESQRRTMYPNAL